MTVFRTIDTLDPFHNLAVERAFFERVGSGQTDFHALLVWRNSRCVVIGRHQNPWVECDLGAMSSAGVPFARRVSGGGTVYHDPGNLNYSFIGTPDRYNLDRHFDVVIAALAELGIAARRTRRNDIVLGSGEDAVTPGPFDGRKISGSAFRHTRNASLHHGTLLIRADLAGLKAFLPGQPDAPKSSAGPPPQLVAESKAIESVRSSVANLVDVRPGVTFGEVVLALRRSYARLYGKSETGDDAGEASVTAPGPESAEEIARYEEELRSWEWLYGKTPGFTLTIHVPAAAAPATPGGPGFSLRVTVRHGRIAGVTTHDNKASHSASDVADPADVPASVAIRVGAAIDGARFEREELEAKAAGLEGDALSAVLAIAAATGGTSPGRRLS